MISVLIELTRGFTKQQIAFDDTKVEAMIPCADGSVVITMSISRGKRPPLFFDLDWDEIPEGIF